MTKNQRQKKPNEHILKNKSYTPRTIVLKSQGNGHPAGSYFKFLGGGATEHGALSKFETNIIFAMFSPSAFSNKTKIDNLLKNALGEDYQSSSKEFLTTDFKKIIIRALTHSNKLFLK